MGMYGESRETSTKIMCGPSRTKQSFKREVNINTIVERYRKTGAWLSENRRVPFYADVTAIGDYQVAMNTVIAAKEAFQSLPSGIRRRFNEDPAEMLAFIKEPGNYDEAVRLGMVKIPPKAPSPGPGPEAKPAGEQAPKVPAP